MEERLPTSKSPTKKDELWITKSRDDEFQWAFFKPTEVYNKNIKLIRNEKLRKECEGTQKKIGRKSFNRSHCILHTNYSRNIKK